MSQLDVWKYVSSSRMYQEKRPHVATRLNGYQR